MRAGAQNLFVSLFLAITQREQSSTVFHLLHDDKFINILLRTKEHAMKMVNHKADNNFFFACELRLFLFI